MYRSSDGKDRWKDGQNLGGIILLESDNDETIQ